jgi:hypothetical protein
MLGHSVVSQHFMEPEGSIPYGRILGFLDRVVYTMLSKYHVENIGADFVTYSQITSL